MAYRFKLNAPLAQEVRRIALEQIEIAQGALNERGDRNAAVHDARRCLKRLRALLRLIREALGEQSFKESNRALADLGKLLSRTRDLHVMEMTVAKLESRNALPKGIADHLRQSIKLSKKAETGTAESGSTRRAEAALKRAERLFAKGRLSEVSITRIAEGLQEAYGKARRAYRQAYEKPSDDAFHAWRKATQAHWRHMQLLSRGWPEAISARVSSAKELSRLLGEDHDLSVLLAFIQSSDCAGLSASDVSALTTSCLDWQREIRRHAKPYAERLYADRPRHLAEHIVGYWTAAGELAKLAALECPGQERTQARLVSRRRGKLSSSDVQGPATGSRHTMQRRKKLMTSE